MPLYQVLGTISVPCFTLVRADDPEAAKRIALERDLDTREGVDPGWGDSERSALTHWHTRRAMQIVKGTPVAELSAENLES